MKELEKQQALYTGTGSAKIPMSMGLLGGAASTRNLVGGDEDDDEDET